MFNDTQGLFIFIIMMTLVIPAFLASINWHHVRYLIRGQIALIARNIYLHMTVGK